MGFNPAQIYSSDSFLSITIALTLTFLLFLVKLNQKPKPILPPGPWKLPLIGNMFHLAGSFPHRTLHDLARKHGPLMHLQLGGVSTIVASDAKTAKEIMKTHDHILANKPIISIANISYYGCTDITFAPLGPYWRQARRICMMELLSPSRVQSFARIRSEEVSDMVRSLLSGGPGPVDLTHKLLSLMNDVSGRITFGKKCREQTAFLEAMKETSMAGFLGVSDFFPWLGFVDVISGRRSRLVESHLKLDRILSEIVEEHRAMEVSEKSKGSRTQDLVDVLLQLQKADDLQVPLTNDNIKAIIMDMFIGGTESSSSVMGWAMAELMRNPKLMERAQKEVREVFGDIMKVEESGIHELNYLKSVVKETLRLHPPTPILGPRESIEECILEGYAIPAKTWFIVNTWPIARDPTYWKNPESFEPERFSCSPIDFKGQHFEFIPFGAGRRGCPGISFALASIEHTLAQLLFYFDWKLPNGMRPEDMDMSEAPGVSAARRSKLIVIPIPHFPLLENEKPIQA